MNLDRLQKVLIGAARANPPSDRVPYAFERRVMARLASHPRLDFWSIWAGALWRAAAPCVAIMLLFGAWSWLSVGASHPVGDLSQDIENTLLAAVDQDPPGDSSW